MPHISYFEVNPWTLYCWLIIQKVLRVDRTLGSVLNCKGKQLTKLSPYFQKDYFPGGRNNKRTRKYISWWCYLTWRKIKHSKWNKECQSGTGDYYFILNSQDLSKRVEFVQRSEGSLGINEAALWQKTGKCKGTEADACLMCKRNSTDSCMTEAKWGMERLLRKSY